jgi:hypothetical protein
MAEAGGKACGVCVGGTENTGRRGVGEGSMDSMSKMVTRGRGGAVDTRECS